MPLKKRVYCRYCIMVTSENLLRGSFSMTCIICCVVKPWNTSSITAVWRLAADTIHVRKSARVPVFRGSLNVISSVESSSIAVSAAVPYLNYNTKPLFLMEKTLSSRKKKKQQLEKKTAQGLTPCAAETHWMYQFIWAFCFPPWKSPHRHNLPTALSGNWISRNGIP